MRVLLGQTQIAPLCVVHLLHIEVSLGLISIIIKVLVNLLFSSRIIMTNAQFLSLMALILLVLKLWINTNLVAQNGLVFPMLDADFLILVTKINGNLHRVLPHMRLRGNWTALFSLEKHGALWIHMLTLHLTVILLRYRVF